MKRVVTSNSSWNTITVGLSKLVNLTTRNLLFGLLCYVRYDIVLLYCDLVSIGSCHCGERISFVYFLTKGQNGHLIKVHYSLKHELSTQRFRKSVNSNLEHTQLLRESCDTLGTMLPYAEESLDWLIQPKSRKSCREHRILVLLTRRCHCWWQARQWTRTASCVQCRGRPSQLRRALRALPSCHRPR